jgi:hypothetical protein
MSEAEFNAFEKFIELLEQSGLEWSEPIGFPGVIRDKSGECPLAAVCNKHFGTNYASEDACKAAFRIGHHALRRIAEPIIEAADSPATEWRFVRERLLKACQIPYDPNSLKAI